MLERNEIVARVLVGFAWIAWVAWVGIGLRVPAVSVLAAGRKPAKLGMAG